MKPLYLLSTLFVLFMFAGIQKAEAADVNFSVGLGGGHSHYNTYDTGYNTWYPSTNSYGYYGNSGYGNSYYGNSYYQPYVYSTPSVGFSSWYGDGYRSNSGSYYGGRSGYGGGSRYHNNHGSSHRGHHYRR